MLFFKNETLFHFYDVTVIAQSNLNFDMNPKSVTQVKIAQVGPIL